MTGALTATSAAAAAANEIRSVCVELEMPGQRDADKAAARTTDPPTDFKIAYIHERRRRGSYGCCTDKRGSGALLHAKKGKHY